MTNAGDAESGAPRSATEFELAGRRKDRDAPFGKLALTARGSVVVFNLLALFCHLPNPLIVQRTQIPQRLCKLSARLSPATPPNLEDTRVAADSRLTCHGR